MSLSHGPFHPDELGAPDAGVHAADRAEAAAAAREIEAALSTEGIHPSPDFVTRVMDSLASEPTPRAAGFLAGLLARPGLGTLLGSIREAWTVASRGVGRPIAARGMAMGYVLAVILLGASLTGVAAIGTAGALGLLNNNASPTPSLVAPSPSPSPTLAPTPSTPDPSASPAPTESLEPGVTPSAGAPTASPDTSDDGGSSPTPKASDDDDSSPKPSKTPDPSDTPEPSETPH